MAEQQLSATSDAAVRLERGRRLREVMASAGVDLVIVTPSADLHYLAHLHSHQSERPTMLAIPTNGQSVLVIPEFESPLAAHVGDVTMVTYLDTQDPYKLLADNLPFSKSDLHIAVTDRMWSAFLLSLQETYPTARFTAASPLLARLRMIKSSDEVERLARAGAMADAAFTELARTQFSGRSELQIASTLVRLLEEQGLETADWKPIVGSGPNSASPHHASGARTIEIGDAVVLDFGGLFGGYNADTTRTVHVGPAGDEFRRVYSVVQQAQESGVKAVRPGVPADTVDQVTRGVIEEAGYGPYFLHRTGHGVGLDIHEDPYIVAGNPLPLEPGMIFSVEPGIYIAGRFGVRIEDIVAVTDGAARRLNNSTHDLQIVA